MITATDIGGDEDAARAVLAYARTTLAPCLDGLVAEDRADALAILRRAAARSTALASVAKTRTAGPWSQTMFSPAEAGSAFVADDKAALAGLCGGSSPRGLLGAPAWSFPDPPPGYQP